VAEVRVVKDVAYIRHGDRELCLDLYRPETDDTVAAVAYFHGGAWRIGDKADHAETRLRGLCAHGVAVASANYRFVDEATFPAQVEDAKDVIRWIRNHGAEYALATEQIGVWGASAGAYIASMVGLTAGVTDLRNPVPTRSAVDPSRVSAVVCWFGPADLVLAERRSELERSVLRPSSVSAMLGLGAVSDDIEFARRASPLSFVTPSAPPFLIAHGDQDRLVPPSQSVRLHDALIAAGVPSTLQLIGGAGHEGSEFDTPEHIAMTAAFFASSLSHRPR
jgi:acetyl esterase/lipase